jgi:transposase
MADTPLATRNQVIALHCHTSKTVREIAVDLSISKSAVDRIIHHWRETGEVGSGKVGRCGRKSKLTVRDKAAIVREAVKDPRKTAREIKAHNPAICNAVSIQTIQRALKSGGLKAYRPFGVPSLTPLRRRDRLQWARQHAFYDESDWKLVSCKYLSTLKCNSLKTM